MALTLEETRISEDPKFVKMLNSLQANILKGHGRNFGHHLFFKLDSSKSQLAKVWIKEFAINTVTSTAKQLKDSNDFKAGIITDGGTIFTLSLTSIGYDALGLQELKPVSSVFSSGMEASAEFLGDNISKYEDAFRSQIHMLIIVADDNSLTAKSAALNIISQMQSFAELLLNQRGNILKMKSGIGIEHFGYADGISQPLYLKSEIDKQPSTQEWNDETKLNLLLIPDPGTDEEDCFGSFLVFRKLEQNVKAFKTAEENNTGVNSLPVIKDVSGNGNPELAGAMLVGRFENGIPVVKSSIDNPSNPPIVTNDFNYSNDLSANKCPFHSHTRLMNPRDGDIIAGDVKAQRITRRGIPYDEIQRIPEEKIEEITDEILNAVIPESGVGLLFMCYQSEIKFQFEIIQGHWANKGDIKGHQIGAQDSLISQGNNPAKTLPVQWGQPSQSNTFDFSNFVTTKGGEYFFTPSISFLKSL